jgi:hypothetical protein
MVSVTEEKLLKAIKKGYPGVISSTGYGKGTKKAPLGQYFTVSGAKGNRLAGAGGHFVCLTGVDPEGRVRVNDPGYAPSGGVAGCSPAHETEGIGAEVKGSWRWDLSRRGSLPPASTTCEGSRGDGSPSAPARVRIRPTPESAGAPFPPCRSSTRSPFWPLLCSPLR